MEKKHSITNITTCTGALPGVFQHSRQKKKREAKLKKNKQFFSYSIVLHVMHADILPIATILITYCLFIVYFIFWVAHRACTKTRTPGLWTMDYGRWTMDDGRWNYRHATFFVTHFGHANNCSKQR